VRGTPDPQGAGLFRLAQATGDMPVTSCTSVSVLPGGGAKFDTLLEAVARAQDHIHMEYYIFEPDRTGTQVRDALAERAGAGVRVRLLLDALGSARLGQRFLRPLQEVGAEVAWFHPLRLRKVLRPMLNLRNHRKLVIIDGRTAFVGGVNIGDDSNERLSTAAFRDLHLHMRGRIVSWLQMLFVEDWHYAVGAVLQGAELWPTQPAGPITAQVLPSGPDTPWEPIHRVFVSAMERAQERIWLSTPYFVPSEAGRMALTSAALRGLDVRLLVPRRADSRVVTWAARSYFDELLRAGVRVFEYLPRMMHSKALLVDGDTVVAGSANFDHRSFRLNFELSVLFHNRELASYLELILSGDMAQSREVPPDRRPSPVMALTEATARLLSPLL